MPVDVVLRPSLTPGVPGWWWRRWLLVLVMASLATLPPLAEAWLHQTWIDGVFDDASPIETPAAWFGTPAVPCPSWSFYTPAVFVIGSVAHRPEACASAPAREASRTRAPPLG